MPVLPRLGVFNRRPPAWFCGANQETRHPPVLEPSIQEWTPQLPPGSSSGPGCPSPPSTARSIDHSPQHLHGSSPSKLDARVPTTKDQKHDHTARLSIHSSQPGVSTAHSSILREAIPTGNRIQSIVSKADGKCAACGQQETDLHHFFHCHLPRATWFRLPTAMRTDLMPLDQDMVFYINFIINQNPAAFTLSFVLTVNTALVPLES